MIWSRFSLRAEKTSSTLRMRRPMRSILLRDHDDRVSRPVRAAASSPAASASARASASSREPICSIGLSARLARNAAKINEQNDRDAGIGERGNQPWFDHKAQKSSANAHPDGSEGLALTVPAARSRCRRGAARRPLPAAAAARRSATRRIPDAGAAVVQVGGIGASKPRPSLSAMVTSKTVGE